MAITETQTNGVDRAQLATGKYLDSGASPAAADIDIGFKPRHVQVMNATDRIEFEWFEGLTSGHAIKRVAAGTGTLETSGGVTIGSDNRSFGFTVIQNKQYYWKAIG